MNSKIHGSMLGKHHSPGAKKKISDTMVEFRSSHPVRGLRGKDHPMFGKHHSSNTKKKIGDSNRGKYHSPKTKDLISIKNSGKNNPMYGVHRFGKDNPMYGRTGEKSPMYGRTGEKNPMYGRSGKDAPMFGRKHSLDTLKKIRDWWKDPEHAKKVFSAFGRKPNKMELIVQGILNSLFPGLFKYVGNGKLFVEGKCPDFVSTGGYKLLIEFNGEYWHQGENTRTRARHFAKYGYKTLFIWDWELKNLGRLKKKIVKFINKYHILKKD